MSIDGKYGHGHSVIVQSKGGNALPNKASMEKGRLDQMLAEIGKKRFFKPKDCKKVSTQLFF